MDGRMHVDSRQAGGNLHGRVACPRQADTKLCAWCACVGVSASARVSVGRVHVLACAFVRCPWPEYTHAHA